jgi:uncharacterized RDD family membrane protein YckC
MQVLGKRQDGPDSSESAAGRWRATYPPAMSDQSGPPIPPGYQPGDYVPFNDRDPANPSAIAGQWADPARQAQLSGEVAGRPMTQAERYRAIYGADAPVRVELASWGRRVLGYLVDAFLSVVTGIPLIVGFVMLDNDIPTHTDIYGNTVVDETASVSGATVGMLLLGGLIVVAFGLYNTVIRQGRTGYSLGKTVVGIRLVKESTKEPMGAGLCFVRQLAHYVDSLVCYLGWLWPLWDARRQTLADKIMGTVVVIQNPDELP